jgi:hypothetical protein
MNSSQYTSRAAAVLSGRDTVAFERDAMRLEGGHDAEACQQQ